MHVVILAYGDMPPIEFIERLISEADLFIATDGAANSLLAHGIHPDVVLGDFDSLTQASLQAISPEKLVPADDQEASDLDKAIHHALSLDAKRITLIGTGGGRVDHTLTAFSLLLKYEPHVDIRVLNESSETRVVKGRHAIAGGPGDIVSLVAFEAADGVSFEGVRWPLNNETIEPGSRGTSNELVGASAKLEVLSGRLLLVHTSVK
jgi:thiamine pyrophosphokinase